MSCEYTIAPLDQCSTTQASPELPILPTGGEPKGNDQPPPSTVGHNPDHRDCRAICRAQTLGICDRSLEGLATRGHTTQILAD